MDDILYQVENHIAIITLNRPDKANALVPAIKAQLTELLRRINTDQEVRCVLLRANGKHFCSGGDLSSMKEQSSCVDGRDRMRGASAWVKELYNLEKPVIAAIHGCAYGAGFSMALASDFIVAANNARFCYSFLNVGLVPDMGALYLLPRRVGAARAKEIAISHRTVSAQEAYTLGIVDYLSEPEELMQTAMKLATDLANGPTYAIGMTKNLCNRSFEIDFNSYLEMETSYQAIAFQTSDHHAAVNAFFDKTTPTLTGR